MKYNAGGNENNRNSNFVDVTLNNKTRNKDRTDQGNNCVTVNAFVRLVDLCSNPNTMKENHP